MVILENIVFVFFLFFFPKKWINEKYSEPHFLQKSYIIDFCHQRSSSPQTGLVLPQMIFAVFSENTAFFEKLV